MQLPEIEWDRLRNARDVSRVGGNFAVQVCRPQKHLGQILIGFPLCLSCWSAEANIGIIQIYRTSHWVGVLALVLAVLVEGEALGRWLHPGPGGASVRERAFWVAAAANLFCVALGYALPGVDSNELSAYLGTQGVMGRHLLAFVGLWIVFSILVELPVALLILRRRSLSILRIGSGVIVANALSSICLAAAVLALRLWY